MSDWRSGWAWRTLALVLILMYVSAPVLAQQDDDGPYREEGLQYLPKNKARPWINWGFGIAFMVGCLILAFKNPHRSHLD